MVSQGQGGHGPYAGRLGPPLAITEIVNDAQSALTKLYFLNIIFVQTGLCSFAVQ